MSLPNLDEAELAGHVIGGKFALDELIGQGSMGVVYRGRHLALDEVVAIKIMAGHLGAQKQFAERFKQEAQAAFRLQHPNSIRVIDFGQDESGFFYLVMEHVTGSDLWKLLEDGVRLDPRRTCNLLSQVLSALAQAHDMGIVHRDLKPENILIQDGINEDGQPTEIARVCDFGIASLTAAAGAEVKEGQVTRKGRRLTTHGLIVGTPEYMSPEQAEGKVVDGRSDLYSVGVILYQMITGQRPFEGATPMVVVVMQVREQPKSPRSVEPSVSAELEAVCLKALAKNPDDRYLTAREMRSALRQAIDPFWDGPATGRYRMLRETGAVVSLESTHQKGAPAIATAAIVDPRSILTDPAPKSEDVRVAANHAPTATHTGISSATAAPRRSSMPMILGLIVAAIVAGSVLAVTRTSQKPGTADIVAVSPQSTTATKTATPAAPNALPLALSEQPDGPTPSSAASSLRSAPSVAPLASARAIAVASTRASEPRSALASAIALPAKSAEPAPAIAPPTAETAILAANPAPSPPPPPPVAAPDPTPAPAPRAPLAGEVTVAGVSNENRVLKRDVRDTLRHLTSQFNACYTAALTNVAVSSSAARGTLHIDIDDSGRISAARARVSLPPSAARCIEQSVVGNTVAGVDTGDASADVDLTFEAH
jgi:serine/threonine protein kinase